MNVLYVSFDGMTDPLGQSQVIPYLKGLAARGCRIVILSCEKPKNLDKDREVVGRLLDESGIRWEYIPYRNKPPVLSTLLSLWLLKLRARRLFEQEKFTITHCRSYLAAFIGLWAKSRYRSKFLFDIRGFWPDERVDSGAWNLKNPLYRIIYRYFKRWEMNFFSQADYVVSLTYKAKEIIQKWQAGSGRPVPVEVIPCCVDLELFAPESVSEATLACVRKELKLEGGDFVVSYLGSVNAMYMFDEMMRFFSRLLRQKNNAKFLFITQTSKAEVIRRALGYGVEEGQLIVTEASRRDIPMMLKLSQIAIFFRKPVFSNAACSPTKQGEIMSLGIPLVCNSGIGDTDFVVQKYEAGLIVSDFSVQEYDRVVKQLDDVLKKDRVGIMGGAREFYSLSTGVERYEAVYRRLVGLPSDR